ncbi:MAG: hypothetical protein H0U60_19635 [Blastocatellia bacterium]|nr:hypothetical protein [Blastocatellia bacterium]
MPSQLARVEEIVNEYARDKAKAWATGIRPTQFQVLLVKGKSWDMRVQRGNPVSILLPWPQAQLKINTLLRDAFGLMRDKKLVDCIEISNVMYTHVRGESKRKWYREHFGVETEMLAELIPQREIKVERIIETRTRLIISDLVTGVKIERDDTDKVMSHGDGRFIGTKTWLELSRMAAEHIEALPTESPEPEEAPPNVTTD